VLHTPLDAGGQLRLARIGRARRLNEMDFIYPFERLEVERLQELGYAGEQIGVSLDTMTGANARLIRSMAEANPTWGERRIAAELHVKLGVIPENPSHARTSSGPSFVVVMQSIHFRDCDNGTLLGWLHRPPIRSIHGQRQVGAPAVIQPSDRTPTIPTCWNCATGGTPGTDSKCRSRHSEAGTVSASCGARLVSGHAIPA